MHLTWRSVTYRIPGLRPHVGDLRKPYGVRVGSELARTSIREVAKRAGVSVGTVSNVLNRPDLVAEATRTRVRSVIDELGFIRNESARRLRQGPADAGGRPVRGRTLGVVVGDIGDPRHSELARGAEAAMHADGFDALWCAGGGSADRESRCLDLLEEQRASGVLITPTGLPAGRIARLQRRGMAVVLIDRTLAGLCSVRVDHIAGGELAVSHLLSRGHHRIALVTGAPELESCRQRRLGAERTLHRATVQERRGRPGELLHVPRPAMTATEGKLAARRLLERATPPSAVFCANDLLAIGMVNELLRLGVKIPGEIAVVGYDDLELASTAAVPLTTVRLPLHELGWTAAELALNEIAQREEHRHRHLTLAPELVVREST
ncbi:LacI family DNA-binding transcriptional regulator [Actinomadura scrupuli]|uniref:LacI family DNA-binding transcriptional regulator n=1 Tax=Actinomadura scrupuli TaxID=559629 RepID=UPI003D980A41